MISLVTLFGCTKLDDSATINSKNSTISNLEVVGGTLQIDSKASLKSMVKSYQKDVAGQNKFNDGIRALQNKGFKPLTPMLDINDTEKIQAFITRKKERLQKMYKSVGITAKTASNEIDLDDELIADPALSSLLNEDREIIIADSLYKYTETGLYFCLKKDKQKLYDYLNKLTVSQKRSQITNRATACDPAPFTAKSTLIVPVTLVSDGINLFLPIAPCDIVQTPPSPPSPPVVLLDPKIALNNQINALPVCDGDKTSWFQGIFGKNFSCIDYFDDRHRIKTEFWDQNWFFYKSVGTEVRTQVKTLGIWWASESDEIYLGINRVYLKYDNPVPEINTVPYLNTFPSYNESSSIYV